MDFASLAQLLGLAVLVVVILSISVIALRRSVLIRSGAIDVSWRSNLRSDGNGWILGQGRYRGTELLLYRAFSPLPGAARRVRRESLTLGSRRPAVGTEPDLLPVNAVIVRCTDGGQEVELALSEEALTGLRSWLESVPPATRSVRLFHRGVRKS
ncbi:DUF2550 domain-containing protein [Nakamurella sp.]|uniref:DUF2550 domain-containing protein n=1 Tax=Nakamurella sp. TaxID=1869182 RepID=UPI003B3BE81D